jgi:hypothetical protein
MMARAAPYDAAHVQKVQTVSGADLFRDIADESLERATTAQDAYQQVARINLGKASRWKLQLVIGRAVGKCAHNHNIARTRHLAA